MGHRHTSEEQRGGSAVCGVDGGAGTAAEDMTREHESAHSLPVRSALMALRFYKAYLSVLFAGACRFQPTCSQYMYEAIERFGAMRGIWLGMKRLGRCRPFSRRFGYDPVPEISELMDETTVHGKHGEAHS
jgi:hypothetical protein